MIENSSQTVKEISDDKEIENSTVIKKIFVPNKILNIVVSKNE